MATNQLGYGLDLIVCGGWCYSDDDELVMVRGGCLNGLRVAYRC